LALHITGDIPRYEFLNNASADVQIVIKSSPRQNRFQLLYYAFKTSEGNKNIF